MAYAAIGRAFWHEGRLAALGGPAPLVSVLYPVLAGLPLLAGLQAGATALRVLQALACCATAPVVFLWARPLVRPRLAATAAALALLLPALAYAGTITAEALLLPLGTLAAWRCASALETPTARNQALAALAVLASFLTRPEACMLALALLAAAVALRRVRALWPTWAAFLAAAAVWLALGGGSPLRPLGGSGPGGATAARVGELVAYQAGDLLLVCGVVPLSAVVLLALAGGGGRARATVALALSLAGAAAVVVGLLAAGGGDRLLEREAAVAVPPLLVGFAVWLDRGAPRPRLPTLAVAATALAALLAMPFGALATPAAAADTPTLVPLSHLDGPKVYGVVALVALLACALLVALPGRWTWVLPALLAGVLAAVSVSAAEEFADRGRAARRTLVGTPPAWIDAAARAPVAYLFPGGSGWASVWMQVLANERVRQVIDLPTASVPGPLPQRQLELLRPDGVLRLVGGGVPRLPYLVAPSGFRFRGRPVAREPLLGVTLWRLRLPARVRTWAQGVGPGGELAGGEATLDVFDCSRGTFHLVAVGQDQETLQLFEDGNPVARTRLWPGGTWEQTVATPAAAGGRCTFAVTSSSLVRLARFAWTPR
jgi:hypothetical protein